MLGRVKSKIWAVVLVAFMPLCRHFFSEDSVGYEVGRVGDERSTANARRRADRALPSAPSFRRLLSQLSVMATVT